MFSIILLQSRSRLSYEVTNKFLVWLELKTAIETMVSFLPPQYIPEVGMNFAYALPNAKTRNDVCAVDGRITKHKERPALCGTIDFGVSKHVASIVLAAMSFDTTMRSAVNIRYSQKTVDLCKNIGFAIGSFDRKDEPPDRFIDHGMGNEIRNHHTWSSTRYYL